MLITACQLVLLHTLSQSSSVATPAPETPIRNNYIYLRGQSPLRVLLACWSLVLIGLSHFLQFTLSFGSRRVHFVIPHSSIPSFTPLRQRTQEHSFRSLVRSHYATFTYRADVFPHPQICGCCIASLHSAKHRHPAHSALTVHSANSTPHAHSIPALAFSNAHVPQKNAPALPYRLTASTLRAISVSGTRSSRIGSPTTHRLHTLSFRRLHFNRIRLAIHRTLRAVSPKFGLNASPTPTPDHPPLRVQLQVLSAVNSRSDAFRFSTHQ